MMKAKGQKEKWTLKTWILADLAAALILAATFLTRIPVGTSGAYLHAGDAVLIAGASLLPAPLAALAAAVGSGLADLCAGSALYILPTVLVKGVMGLLASLAYRRAFKHKASKALLLLLSGAWLIIGYGLFEWAIGYALPVVGLDALMNLLQGIFGIGVGVLLAWLLSRLHLRNIMED